MPVKLKREEIVTLHVLKDKSLSNVAIGKTLGVSEGTVRYHLRRKREGKTDGRRNKPSKAEAFHHIIDNWMSHQKEAGNGRPVNIKALYEHLISDYGYPWSYKSVLRYVRKHYPKPKIRPFRRVETPPGAQAQVDWYELHGIDVGEGPQTLYGFVMTLSHSRRSAVIWCLGMDQLAWHHAHNEAFVRLGGVPATCRIDNVKTGVIRGAGPWGEINPAYQSYARSAGFHIDACLPRAPEDKGKVEARVRALRRWLDPRGRRFESLAAFQSWSDERLDQMFESRICPATGTSVNEAWEDEKALLRPPVELPGAFDIVLTRSVHKDCSVHFENRTYAVPFKLVGLEVEVHGCAETVQFFHDGRLVAEHPRHTRKRILIKDEYYEGPADERVIPPLPLGKLGKKLQEIAMMPVQMRSVEIYAQLAEVAR